tara:strand:- start:9243 stop:9902 length:660 start_codon:yes stop_codon:yes gene_type:complete
MSIMNAYKIRLIIIIISFSTLAVPYSYSSEKVNKTYSISNFKLNQLDELGNQYFTLESSKAIVNPINGRIDLDNVVINVLTNNIILNRIRATNCILDKQSNRIYLNNKVIFDNLDDSDTFLSADSINWDVSNKRIYATGNIKMSYLSTTLSSTNALYNLKKQDVVFTGKTRYITYKDKNRNNPLIELESNYAKIDNLKKLILFKSEGSQVQSTINISYN